MPVDLLTLSIHPVQSRTHVIIAGMFVLALLALQAVVSQGTTAPETATPTPAMLAFEHEAPLVMDIAVATKGEGALVKLRNRSTADAAVSLPTGWKRLEVRGTELGAVRPQHSALDFTRWTLPAGVEVLFRMENRPKDITIINAVDTLLTARVSHADVPTSTLTQETYIITTQVRVPLAAAASHSSR